jgi:hypothetical protein
MWAYAESVTRFSNALLVPPPDQVGELLGAADAGAPAPRRR